LSSTGIKSKGHKMKKEYINLRLKQRKKHAWQGIKVSALPAAIMSLLLLGCESDGHQTFPLESNDSNAIIGGTEPNPGDWPWQAQLTIPGYDHWCGGSLLSPSWVLTAGHCVDGRTASEFTVVLGEHDRNVTETTEQTRSVDEIVLHPSYRVGTKNDIALLHLSSGVTFNEAVRPLRLAVDGDEADQNAVVTGWGNTYPGSNASDVLMQAVLPIRPNSNCDDASGLTRDLYTNELCAGFLNGTQGGCHGDSGGPLVVQRSSEIWEQVGIVSWGRGYYCDTYTVFDRVTSHVDWVRERVVDTAVLAVLF
jgi:secreted trypsin-like serine protease